MGGITVEFDGKDRCSAWPSFSLSPTALLRERAWRATAERRLLEKDNLNELYEKQIRVREQIAANAGFDKLPGLPVQSVRAFRLHARRLRQVR